jgi:hypothetical protein
MRKSKPESFPGHGWCKSPIPAEAQIKHHKHREKNADAEERNQCRPPEEGEQYTNSRERNGIVKKEDANEAE